MAPETRAAVLDPALMSAEEEEALALVREAMERCRLPTGYDMLLRDAAERLEDFGAQAWPALRWVAAQPGSEPQHFIDLIISLLNTGAVPRAEAIEVLAGLAPHPAMDVRDRLREHVHELDSDTRWLVLGLLAEPGQPDDIVTQDSREMLESERAKERR